jgi:hypothetical protein
MDPSQLVYCTNRMLGGTNNKLRSAGVADGVQN